MLTSMLDNFPMFLLILLRMSGAILVNPLFGRKNVPSNVKVALTLTLALVLFVSIGQEGPKDLTVFEFVFKGITEFAIGYAMSLIMNMFLSLIFVASDLIDMQIGIGMAKAYDPGSNISAPITGSIYNAFLILLFFVSNGHITFYKLLSDSIIAIPPGSEINVTKAAYAVSVVLGLTLILALKLALPIVAVEFVTEMGMGVLTRAVPGLNIFSVGIQVKLLVGLLVIGLMAPVFGSFCDELYKQMFTEMSRILNLIKVTG